MASHPPCFEFGQPNRRRPALLLTLAVLQNISPLLFRKHNPVMHMLTLTVSSDDNSGTETLTCGSLQHSPYDRNCRVRGRAP